MTGRVGHKAQTKSDSFPSVKEIKTSMHGWMKIFARMEKRVLRRINQKIPFS